MAYLGQEIDTSQIEPSKPRDVIPPNWYKAMIDASDVKPTKKAIEDEQYGGPAANDRLLNMTFKVMDGEFAGALIFTNLNIVNVNPTAQEIALRDLSAIATAIGKPGARIKDSGELHNRPMMIKVDVEKKEGYNPRNIIKGYKSLSEAAELNAPATGQTASSSAPAGQKAAPAWAKK